MSPPSESGLRIGVLGAAKIAPQAIVRPANAGGRAVITAIAARDPRRAAEFASKHGIPTVHSSYDELLEDSRVDAVYIPLPNGLHGRWAIAAIRAGKHVLCEKPFTANADEARAVAAVADPSPFVMMEAFHWRYHPMAARILQLVGDGAIGEVRSADASICFPLPSKSDIRWQLDLAGGALMDAGCYPVHMLRHLVGPFAGGEPTVTSATARLRFPGVDRLTEAELRFPNGVTASLRASMWSRHLLALRVRIHGTEGRLVAINPLAPHYYSSLRVRASTPGGHSFKERPPRSSTYLHQLDAFCDAVLHGADFPTTTADSIANMTVIDSIYRTAGLEPRRPT